MMQIKDEKFYTLVKFFFSNFFCDYLEEAIEDEEQSVVTLFRGMDYFFEIVKEYNVEFPYSTKEEYIMKEYLDGDKIYKMLKERYEKEIVIYKAKDKTFEEVYGNLNFL